MRYTLIRHVARDDKTVLKWQTVDTERHETFNGEMNSDNAPEPTFVKALEAFAPDVLRIIELPESYTNSRGEKVSILDSLEVRSVGFSYEHDRFGVTIHAVRSLEYSTRPQNISTPVFYQPADGDADGKKGLIWPELQIKIDQLIAHAELFRTGTRAQGELELDSAPPKRRTGRGKGELTPIEAAARGTVPDPAQTAGVPTVDSVLDEVEAQAANEQRRAEKRDDAFASGQPLDEFIEQNPDHPGVAGDDVDERAEMDAQLRGEGGIPELEDDDLDIEDDSSDESTSSAIPAGMESAPLSQWSTRLSPTLVAMLKSREITTLGELDKAWPTLQGTSGFKGKTREKIDELLNGFREPAEAMPV